MLANLLQKVPRPVRNALKKMGAGRLLGLLVGKEELELSYQRLWAKEFALNQTKAREYWDRQRNLDVVERTCGINDETRVLDVGCGIGSVLHFVKGKRKGIDPLAEEYAKFYCYPAGVEVSKGYAERLEFEDGSFDVVFCTNVLDHVESPETAVAEAARVLGNGGWFVLTVHTFGEKQERDPAHPHCFKRGDVLKLAEKDFTVVSETKALRLEERDYVKGVVTVAPGQEMVLVLKKKPQQKRG